MARSRSITSPFWILILGGLSILIFSGFRAAGDTMSRFSVQSITARIHKLLWEGIVVRLTMNIENESGVAIPIDSFQGVLKYGQQVVAPIHLLNPVTIERGQTSSVQFDVPISYTTLGQNITALIESGQFLNNLRVEGVVTAGGINVPFTKNIVAFG